MGILHNPPPSTGLDLAIKIDANVSKPSIVSSNSTSSFMKSPAHYSSHLQQMIRVGYNRWAHFVVAHTFKIVAFCLLITAICATKMLKTKHKNDIRGYTPYGSRSLYEFDVQDEFFDQTGPGTKVLLLILPKKGTNLLNPEALQETANVDNFVRHNLTIHNGKIGNDQPFSAFCRRFCQTTDPVQLFNDGFKDQYDRVIKKEALNPRIQLDYPFSTVLGREVNIQPNFYGVHLAGNKTANKKLKFTNMEALEMIVLRYRAERVDGWTDEDIEKYEMSVSDYFERNYTSEHIRVLTISTTYVQEEIDRTGNILRKFIGLGIAVMVLCSLTSNSFSAYFMGQFSIYKLPVAIFACLCPFLACSTGLGAIFFFGVRNGSILGLTPFLILAIGVDDAFLTIHSWQLALKRKRKNGGLNIGTGPGALDHFLSKQLAEVLEDTGPAILISALTNIFSDLVGMWTGSPEITLLCIGNIASIIVDFFYQITFFTAVLIICARWELRSDSSNFTKSLPDRPAIDLITTLSDTSDDGPGFRSRLRHLLNRTLDHYIRFIANIFSAIFICLISIAFLTICMNAILKFEINLTTKKLFPPDSRLLELEDYREEKVLPYYTPAQLFINNPGDLSNEIRRHKLDAMIDEMEHLPFAYPAQSSIYFPRTFEAFETSMSGGIVELEEAGENSDNRTGGENQTNSAHTSNSSTYDMADLEAFLDWPEFGHWRGLLKYPKNAKDPDAKPVLDSFMAIVAYHGQELKDWYQRAEIMKQWRRVVDKYIGEFNVSVLHDDGLFLDLVENMPTDIWQSALGTLLTMSVICAIFMNFNIFVVVTTSAVIATILIETLGIMALMGMSIDPVVMAAVIISMGFSVDIPAHVSYHFHKAKWDENGTRQLSIEERIRVAFASVGFPAVQASLCTNICILCLLVVPVYPAQVFARILVTCNTLCTIQSLCLLPALFKLFGTLETLCQRLASKEGSR